MTQTALNDGPRRTSWSRRSVIQGGVAFAACLGLRAQSLTTATVPRQRVILDNDFGGDPDGLFQAAHHLLSPSVQIPFVIGSHIHPHDFGGSSPTQAEDAAAMVKRLCATMNLQHQPLILAGRNKAGIATGESAAAQHIVAEAMRDDTSLPLYYCSGAGLTDLAEALRLEPRIASRMKLVWIGGVEYHDLQPDVPVRTDPEYNVTIDIAAAQAVFDQPDLEIWQVPRDTYRTMMVSLPELEMRLQPAGALGKFLLSQLERVGLELTKLHINLGETYILGDSPLVTLTALQSAFEADSSSSQYVLHPRPRIADDGKYVLPGKGKPVRVYRTIDTRLTFEDMFAKFTAVGRQRS